MRPKYRIAPKDNEDSICSGCGAEGVATIRVDETRNIIEETKFLCPFCYEVLGAAARYQGEPPTRQIMAQMFNVLYLRLKDKP